MGTTKDVRLRNRAQMILLAAEKGWSASVISEVVRCDENTVRLWLTRYLAEGVEGLQDEPCPGITPKVTPEYAEKLLAAVRMRPRKPRFGFFNVDAATARRLSSFC